MSTTPIVDLHAPVNPVEPCSLAVVMLIQVSFSVAPTSRAALAPQDPVLEVDDEPACAVT